MFVRSAKEQCPEPLRRLGRRGGPPRRLAARRIMAAFVAREHGRRRSWSPTPSGTSPPVSGSSGLVARELVTIEE